MICGRIWHLKQEIAKLTFRRFETKYHEAFWGEYESVLMMRTFMIVTSRNLITIISMISGNGRYIEFSKKVEEGTAP